jgi:hypothetical protein
MVGRNIHASWNSGTGTYDDRSWANFAGAGFRSGHASLVIILGTILFPIYALIMSGYDLTIPALLLVTILLVGARLTFERRRAGKITVE